MPLLSNAELILRCREINDLARQASDLMADQLKAVAESGQIYVFKHRLKSASSILAKTNRKRAEAITLRSKNREILESSDLANTTERKLIQDQITEAENYGPDHLTDGWGCRYVTLFQDQIPLIVKGIFAKLEAFNKYATAQVSLQEFVIYTNRLIGDRLSIAANTLKVARESAMGRSVPSDDSVIKEPKSKKSAYSSVHIIFSLPLIIEHPGRGSCNEVAQFEVQVRDIFEEGWGEIEHFLVYSAKDDLDGIGNEAEERPWHQALNALKDGINSCSSNASYISRAAQSDGQTQLSKLNSTSATPRVEDRAAVLATLKGKVPNSTLMKVETGYDQLIEVGSSTTKEEIVEKYAAAADAFEKALAEIGNHGQSVVTDRDNRPVQYFLKIELANCYLLGSMRFKLTEAIAIYEKLAQEFPNDPVPRVRLAKAIVTDQPTAEKYLEGNGFLEEALSLIPTDRLTGRHHWIKISALIQLGYNYWRLSTDPEAAKSDRDKVDLLKKAVHVTMDAYSFWDGLSRDQAADETARLLAHKALSNVLYYSARIRGFAQNEREAAPELIRERIGLLSKVEVKRYSDHYKMQDNLMQAYRSIGDLAESRELADQIYSHLQRVAERRAGRDLKFDEIAQLLDKDETTNFMAAVGEKLSAQHST